MKVEELSLPGVKLIHLDLYEDSRGFFTESYQKKKLQDLGIEISFVQDNCSYSRRGVLRGMHYQSTPGQDKLVWPLIGKIYDVVVDIRPSSPTFGKYLGIYLTREKQLLVPKGFAHGFMVMSDELYLHYKVSNYYNPKTEMGFLWNDPQIAIKWPMTPTEISQRDQEAPHFSEVIEV